MTLRRQAISDPDVDDALARLVDVMLQQARQHANDLQALAGLLELGDVAAARALAAVLVGGPARNESPQPGWPRVGAAGDPASSRPRRIT
jgi:hypothetical protein